MEGVAVIYDTNCGVGMREVASERIDNGNGMGPVIWCHDQLFG